MSEEMNIQNTVKIDGKNYDVATLPDVAKIAIEHLVSIDKEVQRLEMARAGFAQAVKSVMDSDEAPEPISDEGTDFVAEDGTTAEFVPEEV